MRLFSGLGTEMHVSGDETGTQWKTISLCCRMLIRLVTSKNVAVILELQKTLGSDCELDIMEFVFGSVLVWRMTATQRILVWLVGKGRAEDRLSPCHKIRLGTNDETSQVSTQMFTVLRHKNWSCKCMEDMYCDSDGNNVILFPVINTFYTCQADVDTKMTVGTFMCMTKNGEMCTVGSSTCLSCEEAPRCMSMIWFSNNTSMSGDEQISMKETCGLCEGNAEQHLLQHCF